MRILDAGVEPGELRGLVAAWRRTSPMTLALWRRLEDAFVLAAKSGAASDVGRGLTCRRDGGSVLLGLPSGRDLCYRGVGLGPGRFGRSEIWYDRADGGRGKVYGGLLCENATQAVARDCLLEAMLKLDGAGLDIILHVHDEIVAECGGRESEAVLAAMLEAMSSPPAWAEGLPLAAEGYAARHYR
jgi:DNA polymerase